MEHHANHRRIRFMPVYWLFIATAAAVLMALLVPQKPPAGYRFVTADHPIDMWNDQSGRWFYYQADLLDGPAPKLAARVRKELLPLGFTEDVGSRPWFRFVKGAREVIVCYHDEIATAPGAGLSEIVIHEFSRTSAGRRPVVLWIHEPGPNTAVVAVFKVKKLVCRW